MYYWSSEWDCWVKLHYERVVQMSTNVTGISRGASGGPAYVARNTKNSRKRRECNSTLEDFSLANINARGIANKITELEHLLLPHKPHVAFRTGMCVHPSIVNCELLFPGYAIVRRNRGTRRGRVARIYKKIPAAYRLARRSRLGKSLVIN